jgi:hypothetical protein
MTVSFIDKIRFSDEEIVEKYSVITLEKYDVDGLEGVIDEIKKMKNEGYYVNLVLTYQNIVIYDEDVDAEDFINKTKKNYDILGYQPLNIPAITRITSSADLKTLYNLIGMIYYNKKGERLNERDLGAVLDIASIVMNKLDKFEDNFDKTSISDEYFQQLRKTQWKNKKARYIWLELGELRNYASLPRKRPVRFDIEQDLTTQFLAACCAVNSGRAEIILEDVVIAFRTYFKLLRADLPLLAENLSKSIQE